MALGRPAGANQAVESHPPADLPLLICGSMVDCDNCAALRLSRS